SHDHYDHLDHETIVAIREWDTTFIAPLGVGAHLEYWGVPSDHIVELDWWDRRSFGGVELVATPARHASGRHLFDQFRTLWAGYALVGAERRVFFSGDTGLFPGMEEIGERLGPFDITMLEVGAYGQAWPDWHLGPEQAVRAHQMLRGELLLPVHWGLFNLAYHAWTEPIERVLVEARQQDVRVASPRPGVSIEPGDATIDRWWPEVPWRTAEEYPIVASQVD
ncbi:MAG: MBL fold metallo-hydrolase, partial [Myxococcota bacterium]